MTDMILPKGIVFNRNDIYAEIAKYDIVPLEQIHAACHVFTTTSRELVDPTARRLENFWTRVLGGDRRYLPGTVIARLFKSISEEESFVKLRGPPNRYEPPSPPRPESKAESAPKVRANPETSVGGPSEPGSKGKARSTKSTPTSTKQPHPILKKPRGPSSSGPRPTARFVSPPGSDGEGEDSKDGELGSSGSTAVNHSGDSKGSTSSTAKEERKKANNTTPKKKIVASTASRRRPAMPRRISSQSSGAVSGPDGGPRDGSSSSGSKNSGSQTPVPTIPEKTSKEGVSTAKEGAERLSAKAAGKRPAIRPSSDKSSTSKPSCPQTSGTNNRQLVSEATTFHPGQPNPAANTSKKTTPDDAKHTKTRQSGSTHRRSDAQERPRPGIPHVMTRSRSDVGASRRSPQDGLPPHQSLISSSTTTVSNTTAQGTIIEFDENPSVNEIVANAMQGAEEDTETSSRRSGNSLRDARFTPTQPSTAPTVPLGRSKSQLTLLLERQGEKKPRR
ncbi:uncharacterized protein GGS22DRAFT_125378 [Annulohypoxylon maeteangense]|uniref:uncharacterized protein n=1 Tax=Annulohypoxylon maeteangense TaxID=1927788 RepID=UPI002007862A|nr:uncharacterized protein GGS22DRAFT_125378 [Annulohypoxylon maeteangense]KAI0886183.1 hypothetical protein GGS22DRAFT_125378 [Annulohypoxylon maeteangense]